MHADDTVPRLDAGATRLARPPGRPDALRRVAVAAHRRRDGPTLWIDARNVAVTHALYDRATPRELADVRVARAFTAYQHADLASRAVRRADSSTGLVVAANVASLYRDDDVPDRDADRLFEATVATLAALGEAVDAAVLLDAPGDDALAETVADRAADSLRVRATDLGLDFPDAEPPDRGYWCDGRWQTTIPYWAARCGTRPGPTLDPIAVREAVV
ncbi:MAG: hypothetical protein ABEJ68_02150 [Halobacteriaceae archaeon]